MRVCQFRHFGDTLLGGRILTKEVHQVKDEISLEKFMQIINHYSMLFSAVFILGITAFFLLRDGFAPKDGIILIVVIVALIGGWLLLRPKKGFAEGQTQFKTELGQGRATLFELQSPY